MSVERPRRAAPDGRPFWWRAVRKILVIVIGVPVVVAGLVMMVTPGPGIPVLVAGLALLAIEFDWAQRHVDRLRALAGKVISRATGKERTERADAGDEEPVS